MAKSRTKRKMVLGFASLVLGAVALASRADNPIIRERYSSDPAAYVYKGKVYLYTGRDEAPPEGTDPSPHFVMKEWRCYSSDDLVSWKDEGAPMSLKTFAWARSDAWASQVIERNGKFYWYAAVYHRDPPTGFSIAVGVADSPIGPFKDALGKAMITNDMTKGPMKPDRNGVMHEMDWDDLDPTVIIDDDKQAWLIWGNSQCYIAKLKENMIELDGEIQKIDVPKFTEAPWIHKYQGKYYLSYAYDYPEKIAYATADKITGPYTYRGIINDLVPNSPTNHSAIIEFKGRWFFFYHNAALPGGGMFHRSVCVEELFYNPDGTIKPITQDPKGITVPVK